MSKLAQTLFSLNKTDKEVIEKVLEQKDQQIAELQEKIEKYSKFEELMKMNKIDDIQDIFICYESYIYLRVKVKELEERIKMLQNIKRYDIGDLLNENVKLKLQLQAQPKQIVEEIKRDYHSKIDNEYDNFISFKFENYLDNLLKKYEK